MSYERITAMLYSTCCVTLTAATLGIIVLMALGHNVSREVSLAVVAQWSALLAVAYKREQKA